MVSIRPVQLAKLQETALDAFVARIVAHLVTELPDQWSVLPAADAAARCRDLVLRAGSLGFVSASEAARFAEVASLTTATFGLVADDAPALELLANRDIVQTWPKKRSLVVAVGMR